MQRTLHTGVHVQKLCAKTVLHQRRISVLGIAAACRYDIAFWRWLGLKNGSIVGRRWGGGGKAVGNRGYISGDCSVNSGQLWQ